MPGGYSPLDEAFTCEKCGVSFKKGSPKIVAMRHALECRGPQPSLDQWGSDSPSNRSR